jgi:hypothetical protein
MNKKVKNAKIHIFNDIKFKSGLELFCYKALTENNINFIYQPAAVVLQEKFETEFKCYENSGKIYRDEDKKIIKSTKRFDNINFVRPITYTPDFSGLLGEWIIETKGYANDSFPIKWKLYKKTLVRRGFDGPLMKPTNQSEVEACIRIIQSYYEKQSGI